MAAELIAVRMDSGHINWRPKFTGGLGDDGPSDKILRIHFTGSTTGLKWFRDSPNMIEIDLDVLAAEAPVLFDKAWLRGQGKQKATIQGAPNNKWFIQVEL